MLESQNVLLYYDVVGKIKSGKGKGKGEGKKCLVIGQFVNGYE